ncbi:MAG: ankyrin repeat domain-containing protein [Gemmatimonadota bacterium]
MTDDAGAEVDICAAAILGRIQRIRELLDADPALVNDRSTNLSPLGWASFGNQVEVATELLARGARLDDGELLCAASVGHVEVAGVLLRHGADPNEIHPESGCNALHAAAGMRYSRDSSDFVSMLLAAGADPRIRSARGRTARQIAEEGARRQRERSEEKDPDSGKNYGGVARLLEVAEASRG